MLCFSSSWCDGLVCSYPGLTFLSFFFFLQHVPIIQQDGSSSEQSSSSNRGINERTTNTGRGIMSRMSLRRGEKSKHRNSCANDQQGTTQKNLCKTATLKRTENWVSRPIIGFMQVNSIAECSKGSQKDQKLVFKTNYRLM